MKIREISIDGFGVWSDLRLADLDNGLNVLYGPNEAGKTTLMQFLRAVQYGFSADRRARYLPPVHGGAPGGEITVVDAEGTIVVRRHDIGDAVGRLSLLSGGEVLREPGLLNRLLSDIDEPVYRNVFAIGLREIQELGSLTDTEAAEWLYKLAVGGDRVSLVDVLGELSKARERLSAGDGAGSITQLLAERDRLRRDANVEPALRRYAELARRRSDIGAQIEEAEQAVVAAEHLARVTEVAAAIYDKWRERQLLDERLAAARAKPRLDAQMLADFDELTAAHARGLERAQKLARRVKRIRRSIGALGLDELLWRRRSRIEALLDEEQWVTALDAERVALATKIGALERERAEMCIPLGLDPAAVPEGSAASSDDPWRRLKPLAVALRAARQEVKGASDAAAGRQKGADEGAKQLAAALAARGATSLTPLLERAGAEVSRLRRRVKLDDHLADLTRKRDELEERSRELLSRALLPGWAVIGLALVFVAGVVASVAAFAAGYVLPMATFGPARWPLVIGGAVTAVGAAATKFLLERAFERRSKTCLAQLETIAGQIDEAAHERDELDEQLPAGGGPLLARLQAAEKEQAAIEALVPLEAARQSSAAEAAAAEQRSEEARQAYAEARRRWRSALVDLGLNPHTPVGRARDMARLRQRLYEFDSRLAIERGELARRQSVIDAFAGRMAQLRAELDLSAVDPTAAGTAASPAQPAVVAMAADTSPGPKAVAIPLVEQLRALRERLRQQAALVAQRKLLRKQIHRLRERRHKNRLRRRQIERRIDALLDAAGTPDAAAFRQRAAETAQADKWANEHDAISAAIAAMIGLQVSEAEVTALVDKHTRHQLDEQWLSLTARVRDLHEQVKAAVEERGRNEQESQTLRDDRQHDRVQLRLAAIDTQLHVAVERWQVLAVTESLLRGVRRRYERERQPETLREASGYLERLTEGRYRRVWTPIEGDVLRVDDAEGRAVPVDVLSRGTREQLFLSLRLALASRYARRGAELPLVLDDVLVNFDARRAAAAAKLLVDFAAAGHQVLLFTCHRHMFEMFGSLGVSVRELPANPSRRRAGVIIAEQSLPPLPVVVPPPETTRFDTVEVTMPVVPPPAPTNGHHAEQDTAAELPIEPEPTPPVEVPPPPPAPPPARKPRATVKFDQLHGPRGPFATAVWRERVTFEPNGDDDVGFDDPRDEDVGFADDD